MLCEILLFHLIVFYNTEKRKSTYIFLPVDGWSTHSLPFHNNDVQSYLRWRGVLDLVFTTFVHGSSWLIYTCYNLSRITLEHWEVLVFVWFTKAFFDKIIYNILENSDGLSLCLNALWIQKTVHLQTALLSALLVFP